MQIDELEYIAMQMRILELTSKLTEIEYSKLLSRKDELVAIRQQESVVEEQ